MSLHTRHIQNQNNNRVEIPFSRQELLWRRDNVKNPYTSTYYDLPILEKVSTRGKEIYKGPNVLDLISREVLVDSAEISRYKFDPLTDEPIIWSLRPIEELFVDPKAQKKSRSKKKSKPKKPSSRRKEFALPFKTQYCTGGQKAGERGEFMVVTKKSTVSIAMSMYTLAVGMNQHDTLKTSQEIADLAIASWQADLERAELLYNALVNSGGVLPDYEVPDDLKANCAVSQEVEYLLYRQVCRWLDVDPDLQFSRRRGRPPEVRPDVAAGEFIEIKLDGEVLTGRTIGAIAGWSADTDLAELTLIELVTILSALQERDANEDIDLLVHYLDIADPNWRENVYAEEAETASSTEDPYTVLGIDRNASAEEIERAYKKIAKKIHPDVSGLPDWIVKQVNRAYEQLKG